DHDSAMFPPAIRPCLSPPKIPNVGTVRTCGPDDTSVLHGISFSAFDLVNQDFLVGVPLWQMESSRRCRRKRSLETIAVFVRRHASHAVELSRLRRRFQRRQERVRMGSSCADTVRSVDSTGYRFAAAMSRHATGGFSLPMWSNFSHSDFLGVWRSTSA